MHRFPAMFIVLITLGTLSAAADIATLVDVARDGYRRVPHHGVR